jgi:hypothetical protein
LPLPPFPTFSIKNIHKKKWTLCYVVQVLYALSDSHVRKPFGWEVEALVKFHNPKIAETTVREMQEKCLIMGDKYMNLLPVLILFAF